MQAMIEKEPITIVLSEKGWVRALKGHVDDLAKLEFKQGDKLKRAIKASTTDKLLVLATNGKIFTLEASLLPGGRGQGEPVRLMIDLEENHDVADAFIYQPGRKLLIASTGGYGFIVPEDEVVASTRKGKQVLERDGARRSQAHRAGRRRPRSQRRREPQAAHLQARRGQRDDARQGRHPAALRRRQAGRRARVQEGRRPDLARLAGRTFTLSWPELRDWAGVRAQAGRIAPKGFPRSNSFGPAF